MRPVNSYRSLGFNRIDLPAGKSLEALRGFKCLRSMYASKNGPVRGVRAERRNKVKKAD